HHLMLANVDQQLTLWVDNKVAEFDQPTTYGELGNDDPQAGSDGGDLAPAGVGSQGAQLSVSHLRVLRDIYYIADDRMMSPITDYQGPLGIVPMLRTDDLIEFLSSPKRWTTSAGNVFDARREVRFPLEADQFFVLGDNSPASSDARFWVQGHYVDRDLLVGKALFIYWPHPLAIPIPMTDISIPIVPNLKSMGFIR
ncbi:MAG TPA: S26 family signal peptidase, partial [Pirellulales bacterium]|nr:S26 family signal peptidase [Pirellulales bacterium]